MMLQILVLAALCSKAPAAITYQKCLDSANTAYAAEALDCDDQIPTCEELFVASGETKPTVSGTSDRPIKCYKDSSATNETIVSVATKICPKTCGLCCLTAKFDCNDNEDFDCDKVKKQNQCKDPWKSQLNLVDNCPKTCGLCEERNGDCQDREPNCDKSQCKNTDFQPAMKVNCKKTCDFCEEETTAAATTAPAQKTEETTAPAKTEPTTTPVCGTDTRCDKWYCGKACGRC
ncbi:unnamed protein product [Cylicocyclus nassatus]|uniref:ShKT domain-containing protein n=1 Tax=Cylicocyclus nassatus TaxID=53992 RepID=A0AA36H2I2_CYLNA|nr:unnamed protein product [Cylicocyclus nassatus]